jgi:hypothetical protein
MPADEASAEIEGYLTKAEACIEINERQEKTGRGE